LSELYQHLNLPDSSAKYALYAYTMLDSVYAQRTTKEVERIQAMYDYTRHQEIAQQEKERASDEKSKRQFTIALLVLIVIVASRIIYTMYEEKKKRQAQYIRNLEELEQTQTEVLQLRVHAEEYEELIAKKKNNLKRKV
jgi:cbb3-type cytochrome oxidase subunit 3